MYKYRISHSPPLDDMEEREETQEEEEEEGAALVCTPPMVCTTATRFLIPREEGGEMIVPPPPPIVIPEEAVTRLERTACQVKGAEERTLKDVAYVLRDMDDDDVTSGDAAPEDGDGDDGGGQAYGQRAEPLKKTGRVGADLVSAEGAIDTSADLRFGPRGNTRYSDVVRLVPEKYSRYLFAGVHTKSPLFSVKLLGRVEMFSSGEERKLDGKTVVRCEKVQYKPLPLTKQQLFDLLMRCQQKEDPAVAYKFAQETLKSGAWVLDRAFMEDYKDDEDREARYRYTYDQLRATLDLGEYDYPQVEKFKILCGKTGSRELITFVNYDSLSVLRGYYPEEVLVGMEDHLKREELLRELSKRPAVLCFSRHINFYWSLHGSILDGEHLLPELSLAHLKKAAAQFGFVLPSAQLGGVFLYQHLKKEAKEGRHSFCILADCCQRVDNEGGMGRGSEAVKWLEKLHVVHVERDKGHVYLQENWEDDRLVALGLRKVHENFLLEKRMQAWNAAVDEERRKPGATTVLRSRKVRELTGEGGPEEMLREENILRAVDLPLLEKGDPAEVAKARAVLQKQLKVEEDRLPNERVPGMEFSLCSEQQEAWLRMFSVPVVDIRGPAGSGKTALLRKVFQRFGARRESLMGTAFQGKNAGDLEKYMPGRCHTTHMLLTVHSVTCPDSPKYDPGMAPAPERLTDEDGNTIHLAHQRAHTCKLGIEFDKCIFEDVEWLVVDEMSTQYPEIFGRLVYHAARCGKLSHLVLTGDVNQLPSIQCGDLLRQLDMAAGGMGWLVDFKHNHRVDEGSRVLDHNARCIAEGRPESMRFDGKVAVHLKPESDNDFHTASSSSSSSSSSDAWYAKRKRVVEASADTVLRFVRQHRIREYEHHVITRTHAVKQVLGQAIEEYYYGLEQQALAQSLRGVIVMSDSDMQMPGGAYTARGLYVNRKMMFKKNDYKAGTVNNEMMKLVSIQDRLVDPKTLEVQQKARAYSTIAPFAVHEQRGRGHGPRLTRERRILCESLVRPGKQVEVVWGRWAQRYTQRASATTNHAYQGGQTHTVFFVLPDATQYDTREQVYTALTRGTHRCVYVGTLEDLRKAVHKREPTRRSDLCAMVTSTCRAVADAIRDLVPQPSLSHVQWLRAQEDASAKAKATPLPPSAPVSLPFLSSAAKRPPPAPSAPSSSSSSTVQPAAKKAKAEPALKLMVVRKGRRNRELDELALMEDDD